jgi:hypothetical protein
MDPITITLTPLSGRGLLRRGLYGLGALFLCAVGVGGFTSSHLRAAQNATKAEVLLKIEPLGSRGQALAAVGRQSEEEVFPVSRTLTVATGRNNHIGSIPTGQGGVRSMIELQNGQLISGGDDDSLRRWRYGQAVGAAITKGQSPVVSDATLGSKLKVIINSSGKISGINNLRIGDQRYNVKFVSGSFENLYMDRNLNPPFKRWLLPLSVESGEPMKAMAAINAVLNSLDKVPQTVGDDPQPRDFTPPLPYMASFLELSDRSYCIPLEYIITERTYGKVKTDTESSISTLCSSNGYPRPSASNKNPNSFGPFRNIPSGIGWDVNLLSGNGVGDSIVYAQFTLVE